MFVALEGGLLENDDRYLSIATPFHTLIESHAQRMRQWREHDTFWIKKRKKRKNKKARDVCLRFNRATCPSRYGNQNSNPFLSLPFSLLTKTHPSLPAAKIDFHSFLSFFEVKAKTKRQVPTPQHKNETFLFFKTRKIKEKGRRKNKRDTNPIAKKKKKTGMNSEEKSVGIHHTSWQLVGNERAERKTMLAPKTAATSSSWV